MILGTSYALPVHPVKARVSLLTCAARVFTVYFMDRER